MPELESLYEALILNPDDHVTINRLWTLLSSCDSATAQAAADTLSDYLRFKKYVPCSVTLKQIGA